jgi:hypothetical protein
MSSKKKSEKLTAKFSSQPKIKDDSVLDEKIKDGSSNEPTPIILDEVNEILEFNVSELAKDNSKKESLLPYQIRIKNLTDEKLYDVDLFNYEHEKQNKIAYSCVHGVSYEYFLRILASYDKPSELIKMMRFSAFCDYAKFQNKQLRTCIRTIITKLDGCSASIPTEIAIYMNAYQQQGNIIDVPITDNERIKFSNQLQLRLDYLMPETEMVIHLFPVKID